MKPKITETVEIKVNTDTCLMAFLGKNYGGPKFSFIPNGTDNKFTIEREVLEELKRLINKDEETE
jgi:hypothetical protein